MSRKKQVVDRGRGDGQAIRLSNLRITHSYLDADYVVLTHDLARGPTGLLKIFSLQPNTAGKPSFEARLDDGSPGKRKPIELDFDIKGVDQAIERHFKANRNGYVGHHSDRSPNQADRIFQVRIAIPAGKIFEGEIYFSATFSMELAITACSSVSANPVFVKATCFQKMGYRLRTFYGRIRDVFR